jgi:enamine deaminase RidA (YjgF/YER057c/UK114 family)
MTMHCHRRGFLSGLGLLAAGGAAGWTLSHMPPWWAATAGAADPTTALGSPEQRLRELGLRLPEVTPPTATFVPTVQVGDLLFVAGHTPRDDKGQTITGKLGSDLTVEQGQAAARNVALRILAVVRQAVGSLDRVARLVKTLGMVNCTPDFTQQPQVINGFSDLIVEVFGPTLGRGTRSAVGMASLPGGAAVEVEAIFQLRA